MSRFLLLSGAAALFLSTLIAFSQVALSQGVANWSGKWDTRWRGGGARIELEQKGNVVIGGLAVALAAQPTLQNFLSGLTLYADRPISVGDFCRFGDQLGTVEDIGMRSTHVRSLDRTVISVPKSEFANMQLEDYTRRDRIRFVTTLQLRYETTRDQLRYVLAELRKLLIAHPLVAEDPCHVRFVGFGEYSLDLEIFTCVLTSDYSEFLAIQEDILLRMMDIVDDAGVQFAFPSQVEYQAPTPRMMRKNAPPRSRTWKSGARKTNSPSLTSMPRPRRNTATC